VIEARVDLDGLTGAFERYAAGTSHAMKTLFQPPAAADGAHQPHAAARLGGEAP
jgi:hypothetical protein